MRVIFKYVLYHPDNIYDMPPGAQIIKVSGQHGVACIWANIDADAKPTERRRFVLIGTGNAFDEGLTYHGTAILEYFVWHVFEVNDGR